MGSFSMLGHIVYKYLVESNKYHVIDTSFPVKKDNSSFLLDATDKNAVEHFIKTEKPDIVINCIGVLIEGSNRDPATAIYLNSFFPHQLSKLLRETGGKLIHISTDCVFSGKKGRYSESDFCDSDDIYGRSKALGEVINDYDLTIRTSKIGPDLNQEGEELFHWFQNQKGQIKGYKMAFWSGVTTLEMAKGIEIAIELGNTGLVHFTNGIPVSKYELLQLFRKIWNRKDIIITESDEIRIDRSLLKSETFSYQFSSYETMLTELKDYMDKNRELYKDVYKEL